VGPRRQDGPDDTKGQADGSEVPADAVEGPVFGLAGRDLEFASGGEFCQRRQTMGFCFERSLLTPRTPDVVLGAQTIDWAGGMIDWKDPTYVAQGNAFKAHVQWVDIQCYSGSDLNLPFVQGNSSSSSNSTKRLRERELWPRAQAINSYIYGSESSFRSRLSLLFVCRGRGPRSYRQWRADQFTERSQQLGRSDWRQRLERRNHHQLGLLDRPEQ
jgi:hypothetical protein